MIRAPSGVTARSRDCGSTNSALAIVVSIENRVTRGAAARLSVQTAAPTATPVTAAAAAGIMSRRHIRTAIGRASREDAVLTTRVAARSSSTMRASPMSLRRLPDIAIETARHQPTKGGRSEASSADQLMSCRSTAAIVSLAVSPGNARSRESIS